MVGGENDVVVGPRRTGVFFDDGHAPGHAQMGYQHIIIVEVHHDVFGAAIDFLNTPSGGGGSADQNALLEIFGYPL